MLSIQDTGIQIGSIAGLEDILCEFLITRRWYRSKTRPIKAASIADVIPIDGLNGALVLLELEYNEGDRDTYVLTIGTARQDDLASLGPTVDEHRIAQVSAADGSTVVLYDAIWDRAFTEALLTAIAREQHFPGQTGEVSTCHTSAFARVRGTPRYQLEPEVSKAEQSNSSIFYGDRLIFKLFRKVEPGINPDFEIGRYLTEHDFRHTPAVVGHLEYQAHGRPPVSAGILQEFVVNQGDAWSYTLGSVTEFFERVRSFAAPPALSSNHPLQMTPTPDWTIIGPYLGSAKLLGERTAEMHSALAQSGGNTDFEPEPFNDEYRSQLHDRLLGQAQLTFSLIRQKRSSLSGPAAENADAVLKAEPRILESFRRVCSDPIDAVRIRHHGDFHLGQVLYTGDDFMIIDFEGEPARPLPERRLKHLAMRDVAGMIRSFQYAAYSALFDMNGDGPIDPLLDRWAVFWTACVSAEYLRAYFATSERLPFIPPTFEQRRLLFDVFVLEKALYEIAYELNNRPAWVRIPMRGILGVVGQ